MLQGKFNAHYDVVIIGGGLAGLTLALQIRSKNESISIAIFERKSHPVEEGAHKVGESTVEVGAYYFSNVLSLKDHLESSHLRKLGTRFFFKTSTEQKLEDSLELGSNKFFPLPTYQIDRGVFENYLAKKCLERGISFFDNCKVKEFIISDENEAHNLVVTDDSRDYSINCRWLIDASGRAGLLKKKLNLTLESDHPPSSAWFRIKNKISVDDWSKREDWTKENFGDTERWFSTNHLMGKGYWVWIIPLASGSTSIGIVADPKIHPLKEFNTFERALAWLEKNEPECASEVRKRKELLHDFIAIKHFSHKCKQVFSEKRWALAGDSGVFIDPFYSPGSDFIAYSNTFLSDLILRDAAGERIAQRTGIYNDLYFSFSDSTFLVYKDQYPVFGDPGLMPVKIIWDFAYYWSFLGYLFVNEKLCDLSFYMQIRSLLTRLVELNKKMQAFFSSNNCREDKTVTRSFIDISKISYLYELQGRLRKPVSDEEFFQTINDNVDKLDALSLEILSRFELSGELDLDAGNSSAQYQSEILSDVFPVLGV